MFPSGPQTRSRFQWLIISVLISVGVVTLPFRSFATSDDSEPTAQVFGIVWNDMEVAELRSPLVTITRGPGGCPPTDGVIKKGVPLCKGDKVKIAKRVKLRIVYHDPQNKDGHLKNQNQVELALNERLQKQEYFEVTISSIFCGSFCRWFASLSNPFRNQVQHVALTNKGTVYEVLTNDDQSVALMVYEGEVEITKVAPEAGEDPGTSAAAEASPSPASTNNPPETVPRLYKVIINPDGTVGDRRAMDHAKLCSALEYSTAGEIFLHQTPPEAAGNLAKLTNFPNSAIRTDSFQTERCASFWEPSQGQHFETLGYIYNDWNDGEKALEMFSRATKLYEAAPNWTGPTDKLRINKAIALRQLGKAQDLKTALDELEAVFAKPDSPLTSSALNVRGSIFYDQARAELLYNRTPAGLANAKDLLAKAGDDFEKALSQAGNQRQYIEVNRGQVVKAEADIAHLEGKYSNAETKYIEAIKKLMDAYGYDGNNPRNKIASVSVARARAALANTYEAMGNAAQSEEFFKKAEDTYKRVIEDVENSQQTFAAPYCGLGSLYLILGRDKAAENYAQCMAFSTAALVREIPVPDVIGLPRAAAIRILAEAGLEPDIAQDGETVETQEPAVPTVVTVGTKIKIKLRRPERS